MFRSLLQTIPTISGNFTLACKLNNYTQNNNYEYTSYINDAILMPLDNNYNLTHDIKINLINGKYEYDIMKYFKEISSYFYDDTYLKNSNIFETYATDNLFLLPDNRDKNFEFGCKRISINKYKYQYQFYAPIYITNFDDLPEEFIIEIYNNNNIIKKIHIPINKSSMQNKLKIYLQKFIEKITNNTPIVWNFNDNKIIYKNAIDCINGGLITISSYNTIQNNNVSQTIINDIDNLICQNYAQNNIILSECIPLSFLFNINDLLDKENDLYYFHFNEFNIKGYYVKNNIKCKYYTFSTNYHNNYNTYSNFNNSNVIFENKLYNLFDNDIIYSLKEGTNEKLYYQNTFKNKYCQWKLLESNSYIINLNSVFTYNNMENKFPVFKNTLQNIPTALFDNDNLYIPINNYISIFNKIDKQNYNILLNNNYTNWFKIYEDNFNKLIYSNYQDYIDENYKNDFYPIYNNYVFINGIKYYIKDNNINYFNIYVNPVLTKYDKDIIVGDIILEQQIDENNFISYKYLEENNEYYQPIRISDLNNKIQEINDLLINESYFIDKYSKDENSNATITDINQLIYNIDTCIETYSKLLDQNIIDAINQIHDNILNYEIYLKHDQDIKYFEYFDNIIEYLMNENYLSVTEDKINNSLNNKYRLFKLKSFNHAIQLLYSLYSNSSNNTFNNLNDMYVYIYQNIFYKYFKCNQGYQKIDNTLLENIKQDDNEYATIELINFIKNQKLIDKIYYSLQNSKEKNNLYYALVNNKINYEVLIQNNITLFVKKTFIEINNINQFYNNIFGSEGLYTFIKERYYINDDNNDSNIAIDPYNDSSSFQLHLNQFINIIENHIKSGDNNFWFIHTDFNFLSYLSRIINENELYSNDIQNTILNAFFTDLLNLIIYISLYFDLINYVDKNQQDIYRYIPYYNDNNNLINYDYYEIIYKQKNYSYLYINKLKNSLNSSSLLRKVFVHITDIDTLKYYLNSNTDTINISLLNNNAYHKQTILNNIDKEYQLIKLSDYIGNYISENDKIILEIKSLLQEFDIFLNEQDIIDKLKLPLIDFKELLENMTFNNSTCELTMISILNDDIIQNIKNFIKDTFTDIDSEIDKYIDNTVNDYLNNNLDNYKLNKNKSVYIYNYVIPIDLYININAYLLNKQIDNIQKILNNDQIVYIDQIPIIIYKEEQVSIKNSDDVLVDIIYNDMSSNKCNNFKYHQIEKNYLLTKISGNTNGYVYQNPYNYLIKTTVKKYLTENILTQYNSNNVIYKNLDNINNITIDYITNKDYLYLIINYNLMLSSNLFNIYNIDNNDNFEIQKLNDQYITNDNIKDLFKYLYPYLKYDLLLNLIIKLNDLNINNISIVLPNNIKCNINTIVNRKKDNENFTNISLTKNTLKTLYLNRYFGNIDPYFIEIEQSINNYRSKIYIITDDHKINNQSNNDNVFIENLDIYNANQINYYVDDNKTTIYSILPIEYKHFNDNYLFNLPNEIRITPDDIDYIYKNQLSQYINKSKCFEYFEKYLKNKYYFTKSITDKNLFLYIFNKYSIEYIQSKEKESVIKIVYKITYKLTLI